MASEKFIFITLLFYIDDPGNNAGIIGSNFDRLHLFSHAGRHVRPAASAWERPPWRNAAPRACMPRHFNNLEYLTETLESNNPALDYKRMNPDAIDNRSGRAPIDLPAGRHDAGAPVPPADAARIESTAYGPGHRFLDAATAVRAGLRPGP
ncbi:hypothetical protein [Burkholderia sp. S-53]|uniref:hypothetical protein n=1 Tax=Burkholderia sp. S-53 TaxID=2906514 RepID=UPI0021D0D7D5|nr:hypothetical protein [Burkholderia sp. S-53]UXU88041.1 hypothetical protein LXM88_06105 [Burkholderia sp. S-53]